MAHKIQPTPIPDKQYVKLIEMCDFLFTDYVFFGKNASIKDPFYITYRSLETKEDGAISWYELCTIDIPIRLGQKIDKPWEAIVETWLYSQTEHLVDYLYEIYEKIK